MSYRTWKTRSHVLMYMWLRVYRGIRWLNKRRAVSSGYSDLFAGPSRSLPAQKLPQRLNSHSLFCPLSVYWERIRFLPHYLEPASICSCDDFLEAQLGSSIANTGGFFFLKSTFLLIFHILKSYSPTGIINYWKSVKAHTNIDTITFFFSNLHFYDESSFAMKY